MESNESSTKYMKSKNSQINLLIDLVKIAIIVMVGVFLIGFFFPYYDYPNDSRGYGLHAIRLANGQYEFSSELLETTGINQFVPANWIKTPHNTAIPDSMPGIAAIGSVVYSISGDYGLFYLGPIFAISFLILSERISTNLFGRYVGLLTLIFLATNEIVFWVGRGLLTSVIFSFFFIFGCFYLIKFLRYRRTKFIILASSLMIIPSFFRLNGIILFPLEIFIIASYFLVQFIIDSRNSKISQNKKMRFMNIFFKKSFNKKILKISLLIAIPWSVFFVFFIGFNSVYFNDPFVSIYNTPDNPRIQVEDNTKNLFTVNSERSKKYLNHFLPYPINRISDLTANVDDSLIIINSSIDLEIFGIFSNNEMVFGNYNFGLISLLILIAVIIFSLKIKINRVEVIVFSIFIVGFVLFYSIEFIAQNRQGSGRDMLPVMTLFYMMLSFLIIQILKIKISKNEKVLRRIMVMSSKIVVILFLIVLIPISFYFSDYSQIIKSEGFVFKDPSDFSNKFPPDFEGITKNSVILTYYQTHSVVGYGAIPLNPTGFDEESDSSARQEMIVTLKKVLFEGYNVYLFKDPLLETEKEFQLSFFTESEFVLKEYSNSFCKVILADKKIKNSDKSCII